MTSTTGAEVGKQKAPKRPADRIFKGLSLGSAITIALTLAAVGLFLTIEGWPGITATADTTPPISLVPSGYPGFISYVTPLVFGTVWAAGIALLISAPIAIGVGLFISHYSPRKLAQPIGFVIDLLAAIPSVVYGLWGIYALPPLLKPIYTWLGDNMSWLPLFGPNVPGISPSPFGLTLLTGALVLAIMILPIMIAINREIFLQTPRLHEEAALALGATRWEMIRYAVFPYARSGMVSAAMLALGRALGETMAIAMIVSGKNIISFNLISVDSPQTIAANIALNNKEATGLNMNLLIATGLVLFVITFIVNFIARAIVDRRKEFSGAN